MKIWVNNDKGDDTIIAFANKMVYKGNPISSEVDNYIFDLNSGKIPTKKFRGIPVSYLKSINTEVGSSSINLEGRGGSDYLLIKNQKVKEEIFNYLKENIANTTLIIDEESSRKAVEKPLIALAVVWLFFIFSFTMALKIEGGSNFEVLNGHSILGIIFILAQLGTKRLIILFLFLAVITTFAFIKKRNKPPVIYKIEIG